MSICLKAEADGKELLILKDLRADLAFDTRTSCSSVVMGLLRRSERRAEADFKVLGTASIGVAVLPCSASRITASGIRSIKEGKT